MNDGIKLDYETADRIALLSLLDHRKYLKKELQDYENGEWLHPEDVIRNQKLIIALDDIINYYGG